MIANFVECLLVQILFLSRFLYFSQHLNEIYTIVKLFFILFLKHLFILCVCVPKFMYVYHTYARAQGSQKRDQIPWN